MDITFYSYFNNMLTNEGIEKTLSYAVERGFTAVEFLDVPTVKRIPNKEYAYELKNALDRYGLKCACYSVGGNILAEEGGMYGEKNGVDTFKQSAEYAAILGAPYFHHTMTIGYNNSKENPDTFDTLFDRLCKADEEVGKYANSLGLTVLYEPQGPFVNGIENFGRLYKEMESRGLKIGVCGDVGNTLFSETHPTDFYNVYISNVLHVHVKDYIIREGDEISENPLWMSNGGKELVEVKLGDGVCEVADYLHKLKAIGYDGGISIETVYDGYGALDSERDIAFVKKYFA